MLKTLFVDDKLDAIEHLKALLSEVHEVKVIGHELDSKKAMSSIPSLNPDFLFLDIQMSGVNGIDILNALSQLEQVPLVIMVHKGQFNVLAKPRNHIIN